MILRRVISHVRNQEWTAIALDFVIVVVGVFIGIQFSNWNQSRSDRDLAGRYVAQISENLRSDVFDMEEGIATSLWRAAVLSELLEQAGFPQPDRVRNTSRYVHFSISAEKVDLPDRLIQGAYYTRVLDNDRPAYTSLVNSGDAHLVADLPAFPCIQSYYAYEDEVLKFEERLLIFRTELVRAQHDAGLSIAGDRPNDDAIARIQSSESLAASLASYRVFSHFHVDVLQRLKNRADVLLETLESGGYECFEEEEDSL